MQTLCFDLDGTLCTTTGGRYDLAEPFPWAVARVNALARAGHRIIIFTARGTATGIDWEPTTRAQLERWGVEFHELRLGKPSADVFIDDRGVHTDTWRTGSGFAAPGLAAGSAEAPGLFADLPVAAPAPVSIVEFGRTFAGHPLRIQEHAARAVALAAAAGLRPVPSVEHVVDGIQAALPADLAAGDVTYAVRICAAAHPALLDTWRGTALPVVEVTCRALAETAMGVRSVSVAAPGVAVRACVAMDASSSDPGWPLHELPEGGLTAGLGARLGCVADAKLTLEPVAGAPDVAVSWLRELAEREGIHVSHAPLTREQLEQAEELVLVALPFGLLPIARLGNASLDTPGPVTRRLLAAWSAEAKLDLAAQLAALVQPDDPAAEDAQAAGPAGRSTRRQTPAATILIPARLHSTRLPRKVLADVAGRPMIQLVHEVATRAECGPVVVLTDAEEVADVVRGFGGEVWMTAEHHDSGTARIASVVDRLDSPVVVNLQGDAPLLDPRVVAQAVRHATSSHAAVTMPVYPLHVDSVADPSVVKVARGADGRVLYCSRSAIPFQRDAGPDALHEASYWGHAGLYAYRGSFLKSFHNLPSSGLEEAERLEQLRWLEAGVRIHSFVIDPQHPSVDTAADLAYVNEVVRRRDPITDEVPA